MKTLILFFLAASLCAAPSPAAKVFLAVTVERVAATHLIVWVDRYSVELPNGYQQTRRDRAHSLAVLVPGTKCAIGDRFDVWAREDGTITEPAVGNQPLRKFVVTSAKRK